VVESAYALFELAHTASSAPCQRLLVDMLANMDADFPSHPQTREGYLLATDLALKIGERDQARRCFSKVLTRPGECRSGVGRGLSRSSGTKQGSAHALTRRCRSWRPGVAARRSAVFRIFRCGLAPWSGQGTAGPSTALKHRFAFPNKCLERFLRVCTCAGATVSLGLKFDVVPEWHIFGVDEVLLHLADRKWR
jgi:hypothetical protein